MGNPKSLDELQSKEGFFLNLPDLDFETKVPLETNGLEVCLDDFSDYKNLNQIKVKGNRAFIRPRDEFSGTGYKDPTFNPDSKLNSTWFSILANTGSKEIKGIPFFTSQEMASIRQKQVSADSVPPEHHLSICHIGGAVYVYEDHPILTNYCPEQKDSETNKRREVITALGKLPNKEIVDLVKSLTGTVGPKARYTLFCVTRPDSKTGLRGLGIESPSLNPGNLVTLEPWVTGLPEGAIKLGLQEFIQPAIDAKNQTKTTKDMNEDAKKFQAWLTVFATVGGSVLGAFIMNYFISPDFRRSINASAVRAVKGIKNSYLKIAGGESARITPMDEFNDRLSKDAKMVNLSKLAREWLEDPEAFKKKYPEGIPGLGMSFMDVGPEEDAYIKDLDLTLKREKNASAWLVGQAGDGKTTVALAYIIRAARGDYGEEMAKTDFWTVSKSTVDGQTDPQISKGYLGGTDRFAAALNQAAEKNFKEGRPIVFFGDEIHGLVEAGLHVDGQGKKINDSIIESFLTKAAGGRTFRIMGTSTPDKFARAVAAHPDFFGEKGRGKRHDRPPKTREDVMGTLKAKEQRLGKELSVRVSEDVLREVADLSLIRAGSYNPRAAENDLDSLMRKKSEGRQSGTGVVDLTMEEVRTVAQEEGTARFKRAVHDATAKEWDPRQRLGQLEQLVTAKVISGQYPSFNEFEKDRALTLMGQLITVWEENGSIRGMYLSRHSGHKSRALEAFVRDAVKEENIQSSLREMSDRHEGIMALKAELNGGDEPSVKITGWDEHKMRKIDDQAIFESLEKIDPKLANYYRETISTKFDRASTVGDLLDRIGTDAAEEALQEARNRSESIDSITERALFELISRKAESEGKWSAGDAAQKLDLEKKFETEMRAREAIEKPKSRENGKVEERESDRKNSAKKARKGR